MYQRGIRIHGRYSTVFLLPGTAGGCRLGVAATRKLGGAVERNRAKRLIREVFRRSKVAQNIDVVVVPRRELLDASLIDLEADYCSIVERYLRRRARDSKPI